MKSIDSLLELANTEILRTAPNDALWVRKHIREWAVEVNSDDSFMDHFGGHVFVLEEFKDFAQVTFFDDNLRTRNLLCDYGAFDQCEYIYSSRVVAIHQITSNSGGATYYIPSYLTSANPFVELSINESN